MSTKRERIILAITAPVLIVFALDSWILTPLMEKTAHLRAQEEKLQTKLRSNQTTLQKRRSLAGHWSGWVRGGLKQNPSEAESQILNAVRAWARDTGVNLVSIQPERPSQKGELREIRFQASVNGAYGSLVRFLYLLETADDIPVRAQRLDLHPVRGGNAERLVLDLRFSTLYLVPELGDNHPPRGPRSAAGRRSSGLTASRPGVKPQPSGT